MRAKDLQLGQINEEASAADLTPILAAPRRTVRRRRRPLAFVKCPSCHFRARQMRAAAVCVPCNQLILPLTETDA